MKKNNAYLEDAIDLGEIIKKLWREKILILSISLIFMVAGYVYGAIQPKIYKTEIILREAPPFFLQAYKPFFSTRQQRDIATEINEQVKLNLSSLDTLVQFVEETNTINDFKNHLKEKNISASNYFREKFEYIKKNNIHNKYSLTYSEPLPGETFLNDYIIFVWQQTMTMFRQQLIKNILNEIDIHKQNLEIAKKINLENPILKSMVESQVSGIVSIQVNELFYKGTIVITKKIIYLNKLLNETKNLTSDLNPILEQASRRSLITKSPIIYATLALLVGLFFSMMIVFIRSIGHR